MPVSMLPHQTRHVANAKARRAREDSSRDHDGEEVPESANEFPARQLPAEQPPRERRDADEADEKTDISREILYRGPAQMIELRRNLDPSSNTP